MKTVQEWLNEVNEHELVDTYFAEFPIDYEMIPAKEMTLGEIKNRLKSRLLEFIRRMKGIFLLYTSHAGKFVLYSLVSRYL